MATSEEDIAIQDFIEILEEHRKACERQGKYIEAEIAKNRLEELKLHEEHRQREIMRSRHIKEKLNIEQAHMKEFQDFNSSWDAKMKEYEISAAEMVESLRAKHAQDLHNFQKEFIENQSVRPKFSKELLNIRKIQETVAKTKDYQEAHKLKLKGDALEAWELEKWEASRKQELVHKEVKYKQSKQGELLALQKRINAGKEEMKKQRHNDLERLLQRYQNVKGDIEAQHNHERIKLEKSLSNGGNKTTSKPSSLRKKTVISPTKRK